MIDEVQATAGASSSAQVNATSLELALVNAKVAVAAVDGSDGSP